jgi:protein O-GlcNAc transferase
VSPFALLPTGSPTTRCSLRSSRLSDRSTERTLAQIRKLTELLEEFPASAHLHSRLGARYLKAGNEALALRHHQEAFKLDSDHVENNLALGHLFLTKLQYARALHHVQRAYKQSASTEAALQLAWVYLALERKQEALHLYRSVLSSATMDALGAPTAVGVLFNSLRLMLETVDWSGFDRYAALLAPNLKLWPRGDPVHSLGFDLSRATVAAIASHAAAFPGPPPTRGSATVRPPPALRVAYLSVDLDLSHPVGQKLCRLLPHHAVDATVFSVGPFDRSMYPVSQKHVEVSPASDHSGTIAPEASGLADELRGFSVVVNVDGHAGQRGKGVASRNYVLADPTIRRRSVVAFGYHSHFSADSYLLVDVHCAAVDVFAATRDRTRYIVARKGAFVDVPSPVSFGRMHDPEILGALPFRAPRDDAWVTFCNFGDVAKIQPQMWSTWMSVLRRVPRSRLWIIDHKGESRLQEQLRDEMRANGVHPSRLVVSARLDQQ